MLLLELLSCTIKWAIVIRYIYVVYTSSISHCLLFRDFSNTILRDTNVCRIELKDVSHEACEIPQEPRPFEIYYGGRFITMLHNIFMVVVAIFSYRTR